MSNKTLHIKKTVVDAEAAGFSPAVEVVRVEAVETLPSAEIQAFTEEQLLGLLRDMRLKNGTIPIDTTVDLPIGPTPAHLVADKGALPPIDDRTSAPLQVPAARLGRFDINGIPVLASPVIPESNIDPRTGSFYTQIGHRPKTQISPTPSRRFDGR